MGLLKEEIEELDRRIAEATVSETAKEFYKRRHSRYVADMGWSDSDFESMKELNRAGLIKVDYRMFDDSLGGDSWLNRDKPR
jgi:hypothetical protein